VDLVDGGLEVEECFEHQSRVVRLVHVPMVPERPDVRKMADSATAAQAGAGSKRSFSTRGGTRVG
jgi:hypothetical protein